MVHAYRRLRGGGSIVQILRETGGRRQRGEQDGQSQGAQNTLRLAAIDPEGRYRIYGEVHGVTDCQTDLLVSVEAICRRRIDHRAPRHRGPSEWVVAHLGHHNVIVGLGCSADAFESEALVVGVLSADFDRPERSLENRVIKPDGVLSDLRGIAVAGGGRRVFDIAAGVVVERIAVAEWHRADIGECGAGFFETHIAVEIQRRRRVPDRSRLKCRDWKKLDETFWPQRWIRERSGSEATERAICGRGSKIQCFGNDLQGNVTAEADIAHVVILEVEVIIEVAIKSPSLDMKLVGSEHRIPSGLYSEIRQAVQAQIVRIVEEASAGPGQIDKQIRVQHPLRSHRWGANCRIVAADKGRLSIFGRKRDFEFRSNVLPDANAGLASRQAAGHE